MPFFSPLDWLRETQNWFSKTERSSGFRPMLIFCLLVFGLCIVLLTWFSDIPGIPTLAIGAISATLLWFFVLAAVKAFQDPDFCRSERHVQTIKKLTITQQMGEPPLEITGDTEQPIANSSTSRNAIEIGTPSKTQP